MKLALPSISAMPIPPSKSAVVSMTLLAMKGEMYHVRREPGMARYRRLYTVSVEPRTFWIYTLQKPVSRPIVKFDASWLKATDKATGLAELSITGLVFMFARGKAITSRIAQSRDHSTARSNIFLSQFLRQR